MPRSFQIYYLKQKFNLSKAHLNFYYRMNGNKLSLTDYQIFLFKALTWLILACSGLGLAIMGFFHAWIAWILTISLGLLITKLAIKHRVTLKMSREMWVSCLAILAIVATFSFFSTPSVFSGRDQGSFSEAAIRLSQNHSFFFETKASNEFFKLHEKGRAQNFPGFYYTSNGSLVTQFPLAYIAWLALFFSLFGVAGFVIANAVLLYFFLLTFYLLTRLFLDTCTALPTFLFAVTSFCFMWFSRYTLSENMALPLLWLSILSLMLFLKNQRRLHYIVFLAAAGLLSFTRIEGFAFLALSLFAVYFNEDTRNYIKENLPLRFFLPMGIFLIVLVSGAAIDINFYRELVKAFIPSINLPRAQYLGNINESVLPEFYNLKIMLLYGLFGFFLLGAFSVVLHFCQKQYYKLIPFFITLPTTIYLFDSHISSDHPWMLRRFTFSLLPMAIFYSGLLLGAWFEKKSHEKNALAFRLASFAITIVLLAGNFPAFSYFLTYSENKTLLEQTKKLSEKFSANDLILVDQKATGDGWSMMTEPMSAIYGKNAVYFFNNQDLGKLDLKSFDNVYLIASNSQVPYYTNSTIGSRLTLKDNYSLEFSKLDVNQDTMTEKVSFPEKVNFVVQGKIFQISK